MKRTLLALALTLVGASTLFAQTSATPQVRTGSGVVRGRVLDAAAAAPLASATVSLWSQADSSLVAGVLSRKDGSFAVEGLLPGAYTARVTFVGYAPYAAAVEVGPGSAPVDLGAVALAREVLAVEGVTATAERGQAVLAVDRNVYNVRAMPAAAGGSAVEALQSVPAVEVDIDGNVSLRGSKNVAVQINGRAVPMRGEQLGQYLQQMPGNLIDRIEVVPSPSAKHDPEGMAGIVNIVLRGSADLGTSGGFLLGGGTTDRLNASGNLGYQQGRLTLFGSYGFMADTRTTEGIGVRENLYVEPTTWLEQRGDGSQKPLSHTLNLNGEYRIGERDLVSTSLVATQRVFDVAQENLFTDVDASRAFLAATRRYTDTNFRDRTADLTLGYRRTLEPQRHELSAELRANHGALAVDDQFRTVRVGADGTALEPVALLQTNSVRVGAPQYTAQADYTRSIGPTRVETGYKGTLRRVENDFQDLTEITGEAGGARPGRTHAFDYEEQIHAAYGLLSGSRGALQLQAGLRAERSETGFTLSGPTGRTDSDYVSLFPSAAATVKVSETQEWKLSYAKRIQRPETPHLNPFTFYEDPLNVQRGNPRLRPEYTHALELTHQRQGAHGTLQLSPYYRHTTGAIRPIRTVEGNGVTTTSFLNYATSDSYGTDVTAMLRGGPWNGMVSVSAFRTATAADASVGSAPEVEAFGWSVRANGSWKINPALDAQAFLMYRAPMDIEIGRLSGLTMMHFALRQKLLGDKANLTLRVVDPLAQMRVQLRSSDERHVQDLTRSYGARGVYLTFGYSFGQQPKIRQNVPQEPAASPLGGIIPG